MKDTELDEVLCTKLHLPAGRQVATITVCCVTHLYVR